MKSNHSIKIGDILVLNNEFPQFSKNNLVIGTWFEVVRLIIPTESEKDVLYVLRDYNSKIAIGTVTTDDVFNYFSLYNKELKRKWSKWVIITNESSESICYFRTNNKKIQVKSFDGKYKGEASCHTKDKFNISVGIRLAYLRMMNKYKIDKFKKISKEYNQIKDDLEKISREIKFIINKELS